MKSKLKWHNALQCIREQLRKSSRFQAGAGAMGGKEDENNITKEFLLGKPKLPRVYEDFTSGSFIEKDSLLLFNESLKLIASLLVH